ncbi:MAG: hypothetical protein Q8O83_02170 [bacterium]|nr:hypothetical protein [bacterium]
MSVYFIGFVVGWISFWCAGRIIKKRAFFSRERRFKSFGLPCLIEKEKRHHEPHRCLESQANGIAPVELPLSDRDINRWAAIIAKTLPSDLIDSMANVYQNGSVLPYASDSRCLRRAQQKRNKSG